MKIIIFNNSTLHLQKTDVCIENGAGNFAKELKEMGHEVTVYGQMLPGTAETTDTFHLKKNGLTVAGTKRKKSKFLTYLDLYGGAVREMYKADFSYFFYPTAMRYVIFAAVFRRKPYGLYIRGIDDLKRSESHIFYKKACHIFTVADYFTSYVNHIAGRIVAETVRPMINFSELNIIYDRQYRSPGKMLRLLYLGRMTDDKGIIELLHATKALIEKNIPVHLDLVGSGEYFIELKNLCSSLQLEHSVTFAGPVFDKSLIENYYLAADIFVLPSYHEGFPRTIYEAMIFGTPIITTFVGGISGIMKDKVNCLEIQPKSVKDLVDRLTDAYHQYPQMVGFAKNARTEIQEILTTRKKSHAQALSDLLKKLGS